MVTSTGMSGVTCHRLCGPARMWSSEISARAKARSSRRPVGVSVWRDGWPSYKPDSAWPLAWQARLTRYSMSVSTRSARVTR